jgi:hypothetical protein
MKKKLIIGFGVTALIAGAIVASIAMADATAVGVTCSGTVSTNQITWSAVATGGNAPYVFAWSGDSQVAGSTSTSIVGTYVANGTYTADIMATDASSTVATSSCQATVTSFSAPAPTSTLNVFVSVNNATSGTATAANFTVSVSGANATPSSFTGTSAATPVVVNAAANYSVNASALANYAATKSGNCAGPIAAGATDSCTLIETYVAPGTTTPSPTARVNPPSLSIGPKGAFLGRGMTVMSIGTNSFTAEVWGITYTINWSGSFANSFQFWYRYNEAGATTTPSQQLSVGDEVGVSGTVSSSSPLVVTASVVRDYSILVPRPVPIVWKGNNGSTTKNNGGNGNGNGNGFLKKIQNLFHFGR